MSTAGSGQAHDADAEGWVPRVPDLDLVRQIGKGSHGNVWLARTVTGVWRAVKVVRRNLFRDEGPYAREFAGVQRFEPLSREDEGFVDVLHTGRNDAEGYFYYVMELADDTGPNGFDPATYKPRTLARVLSVIPRLPVDECVRVGIRLASALARLHREGLIHRDVKPSNIIFIGGQPKLADIGLVVEESKARSYVGTEGYIPPEGPNSKQADLFSLGMVLYEAVMGRHRKDFPSLPDAMDGGADAVALRELNAVILKACASHPNRRYASAEALGEDLSLIASGGSVRRRRRWREWRRRGVGFLALAALLAAMATAWNWRRTAWLESGRRAQVDQNEQRLSEFHQASIERALDDGDDATALLWLARQISLRETQGETRLSERVLVRQLRERLPEPRAALPVGPGLFSVSYSPDGSHLVTCDNRGRACVWDAKTGAMRYGPFPCATRPIQARMWGDGFRAWFAPRIDQPSFQFLEATGSVRWFDFATGAEYGVPWEGIGWAVESPDHRWLATAEGGYRVGLGRADGGGVRRRLEGHTGPLEALVFSPECDLLFSGSYDGTVRVWSVPEGKLMGTPIRLAGHLQAMAVSPGGRMLTTLAKDGSQRRILQWWDRTAGVERLDRRIVGSSTPVLDHRAVGGERLVVNGDMGGYVVLSSKDGSVCFPELSLGGSRCLGWDVQPGGLGLLVGRMDGRAHLWSLEDGQAMVSLPTHPLGVRRVGFHPADGSWFTASEDGLVRIWNRRAKTGHEEGPAWNGEWRASDRKNTGWGWRGAAWNSRGDTLMVLAQQGAHDAVMAFSVVTGEMNCIAPRLSLTQETSLVSSAEGDAWALSGVSPESSATPRHAEDVLWIARNQTGWVQRRLPHPVDVSNIRLVTDGRLVTIDTHGTARRWDAPSVRVEHSAELQLASVGPYVLSEDGLHVADLDPAVRRVRSRPWERTGAPTLEFPMDAPISGIGFFGRSPLLTTIHPEAQPMVWDIRRGRSLPLETAGLGRCRIVDWNEQNQWLLVCPELGLPIVMDLAHGARRPMGGGQSSRSIFRTGFSQDGRWVITLDRQNRVQVHDAASGQAVTPPLGHAEPVWWAGISKAQILVTLSGTRTLRRWSLEPDSTRAPALVRMAEAIAGRRLDEQSRETWIDPKQAADLIRQTQSAP